MKNISIENITIKIGKKTIELTPDEAKELKYQLDGFIGVKEYVPYYPLTIPYIIPSCPYVAPAEPYYPPYEVTWGPVTSDICTVTDRDNVQWSYTN